MAKSKHRKKVDPAKCLSDEIVRANRKVMENLRWEVEICVGGNKCEIVTDPKTKHHLIRLPKHDPSLGLGKLHELCHAQLAETAHHLFGSGVFKKGTNPQQIVEVIQVLDLAKDWFIEELEHSMAPRAFEAELIEHIAPIYDVLDSVKTMDLQLLCGMALLVAQADRYLNRTIQIKGTHKKFVEELLAADPAMATKENLTDLVNKLLLILEKPFGRVIKLECIQDGEIETWGFI